MNKLSNFNLTNQVKLWKNKLMDSPFITHDIGDELESHLLDEIEEQQKNGLSDLQSFKIAIYKMGSIKEIHQEFSKL